MKKVILYLIAIMAFMCFMGCNKEEKQPEKVRDLEFTVVATANIPEELVTILDEKKTDTFYQAYADGEYMYLCVGYGEQATGGYSITINELYLTEENICMDTTLVGPAPEERVADSKSYPYVVVCTEYIDLPVLFE